MKKAHITDHRRVRLDKMAGNDFIPFLGGRPFRDKIINEDDLLNLSIALNTSKSWNEFIGQL